MHRSKYWLVSVITILTIILTACGSSPPAEPTIDPQAIFTAAAQTVAAQLTQTAAAATPTPEATATETPMPATETPSVTETPTTSPLATAAQALCDDAKYVSDVSVPDGTVYAPNQEFVKTWKIVNAGTCTWKSGYKLVYGGYTVQMSGQAVTLGKDVVPGEQVDISIVLRAPSTTGEHLSAWRMSNDQGFPFGEFLWVKIVVR